MRGMKDYTVYCTVNRPNGTDFDLAVTECVGWEELENRLIHTVLTAMQQCQEETELDPNSIIITVVPG